MPKELEVGKIYGGVKVILIETGKPLIDVQCMNCGQLVKKWPHMVATRRTKSCGRFDCKEKSKAWKDQEHGN